MATPTSSDISATLPGTPQPPPHAKMFICLRNVKAQLEDIERSVAQTLGYFCAGLQNDITKNLTSVLDKVRRLQVSFTEFDAIKHDVAYLLLMPLSP